MKKELNKQNYCIDFYRFVFSLIIVFYHSWMFTGKFGEGVFNFGFLAVDFYFIVSGYLMMNSMEKQGKLKKNENVYMGSFNFVFNKIKKIFPALLLTFIIGLGFVYGKGLINIKDVLLSDAIPELLQLGVFGYSMPINLSWWYLSVMYFVFLILYPIIGLHKDKYIYYIAPLILGLTMALVLSIPIGIHDALGKNFVFINGFYNGIIFIILGNISYEISKKFREKSKKTDKKQKILLTLFEQTIYIILILTFNYNFLNTTIIAFMLLIAISLTFSNITYSPKIFASTIWKKLGNYGFYVYLCHISIRTFFMRHNNYIYSDMLSKYLLVSFVTGLVIYIMIDVVYKRIKERKKA